MAGTTTQQLPRWNNSTGNDQQSKILFQPITNYVKAQRLYVVSKDIHGNVTLKEVGFDAVSPFCDSYVLCRMGVHDMQGLRRKLVDGSIVLSGGESFFVLQKGFRLPPVRPNTEQTVFENFYRLKWAPYRSSHAAVRCENTQLDD